jgi:hypothetical protein
LAAVVCPPCTGSTRLTQGEMNEAVAAVIDLAGYGEAMGGKPQSWREN